MKRRSVLKGLAATALAPATMAQSSNFYVPAEERHHELTFMQWPVSRAVYNDGWFLDQIQTTIATIANAIAAFEPVILLAGKEHHAKARRLLSQAVVLWDLPTEDLWARDSGPITAINDQGRRKVQHIQFNGWGNRQVHRHDGRIAQTLAQRLNLPLISTGLKGEAGGVEQDGHGLLVAHESSWVHGNRNPGQSRSQIEARLLAAYGADRCIWSPGLKDQDITDYHIDSLMRFTGRGRALLNLPDQPDPYDAFHQSALQTHNILRAAGLEIDVIPEPNIRRVSALDFVASYANYYVCNGAVIAAQFGDEQTDAFALQTLARHYPGREIVMLNADALGQIGGGIHCATHELPAP